MRKVDEPEKVINNKIVGEGAFYAARRKNATEALSLGAAEARKEEYGSSSIGVPEDSLIFERVEVMVQKSHVTLGIIDDCYPTTSWHVGPLADVKWITSDRNSPGSEKLRLLVCF